MKKDLFSVLILCLTVVATVGFSLLSVGSSSVLLILCCGVCGLCTLLIRMVRERGTKK